MYRVAWKVKAIGYQGHGKWQSDYALVNAWVKYGNKKYSKIEHWVEAST